MSLWVRLKIGFRFRKTIVMMILMMLQSTVVFANSAPTYWQGYPYSEVLLVDASSPVSIINETLRFDFNAPAKERHGFTPTAKVTAAYTMKNTSHSDKSVQMAFSLVSSLSEFSVKDLTIESDGNPVSYQIYPAMDEAEQAYDSDQKFHYGGLHISTAELELPGIDLNQNAKLLRYQIKPVTGEDLRFEVSFKVDPQKTRLIGKNFNMASYTEGKGASIGAGVFGEQEQTVEILVLGEPSTLKTEVLTQDGKEADPSDFRLEKEEISVAPLDYLMDHIRRELGRDIRNAIEDTQLINLYLNRISNDGLVAGYSLLDEVLSVSHADRIITLLYTVEFPADTEKTVRVGYLTNGTMDRRETSMPRYLYTYLLSPAKHWQSFGKLELEIRTPQEAPYLIESTLPLELQEERRYTAVLDGLPEQELQFTLYNKEQVTTLDKVQKSLDGLRYLPMIISIIWPILLVACLVIFILRRIKKAGNGN
jgi:hypothetical protein